MLPAWTMTTRQTHTAIAWLGLLFGVLAWGVLGVSMMYTPEAIAAGAHLADIGVEVLPCPGCVFCGMSRAFAAVSHLQFDAALQYNPGVFLHYPLALFAALCGPGFTLRHLRRG